MKLFRALLCLACFHCLSARADLPANWSTNFAATLSNAASAQAPVLAFFTASWCGPCKLMTGTTLADPGVVQALSQYRHVAVDIDASHNLALQHNIEAVPTFIIMSPFGDELQRTTGFQAPDEFLPWLTNGISAVKAAVVRQALVQKQLAEIDQLLASTNTASCVQGASQLFELCSARDDAGVQAAVVRLRKLAERAPAVLLEGLNDPHLATRIQVANALRARLGDAFDVDPWSDAATRARGVDSWRKRL
jgi:thioredoxin-like negative regulator of GroEL